MNRRQGSRKGSKDYRADDDGDRDGDAEEAVEQQYEKEYTWRDSRVGENPESIFIREETRREMLANMTDKQREVFILYFSTDTPSRSRGLLMSTRRRSGTA